MTTFWLNDPNVLIDTLEFWPSDKMNEPSKYNAITRLVIGLTVLGFIFTKNIKLILVCLVTLGIIIFINKHNTTNEPFIYDLPKIGKNHNNPFNNRTHTDTSNNPVPLAYEPVVKEQIKSNVKQIISEINPTIDKRLFRDIGDDIDFDESLRPFYTTASSHPENDQSAFAKYCYNNLACDKYTLKKIF
jgi:hypothetical protein